MAGVSHDTIHKVKKVEANAPDAIRDAASGGAISINRAYNATKAIDALPEAEQEDFREKLKSTYDMPEEEQMEAVVEILKDLPKAQQNEGVRLLVNNSADILEMEESTKRCKYFNSVLYKAFTLTADRGYLESWLDCHDREETEASLELLANAISNLQDIEDKAREYIAEKSKIRLIQGGQS